MASFIKMHEVTVTMTLPAVGETPASSRSATYVFLTSDTYKDRTTETGISESGVDAAEAPLTPVKELLRVGALRRINVAYKPTGAAVGVPDKKISLLIAKGKDPEALKAKTITIEHPKRTTVTGTITRIIHKRGKALG